MTESLKTIFTCQIAAVHILKLSKHNISIWQLVSDGWIEIEWILDLTELRFSFDILYRLF